MNKTLTQKDLEKRLFDLSLQFKTFVTPIILSYYEKLDKIVKVGSVQPYKQQIMALYKVEKELSKRDSPSAYICYTTKLPLYKNNLNVKVKQANTK